MSSIYLLNVSAEEDIVKGDNVYELSLAFKQNLDHIIWNDCLKLQVRLEQCNDINRNIITLVLPIIAVTYSDISYRKSRINKYKATSHRFQFMGILCVQYNLNKLIFYLIVVSIEIYAIKISIVQVEVLGMTYSILYTTV